MTDKIPSISISHYIEIHNLPIGDMERLFALLKKDLYKTYEGFCCHARSKYKDLCWGTGYCDKTGYHYLINYGPISNYEGGLYKNLIKITLYDILANILENEIEETRHGHVRRNIMKYNKNLEEELKRYNIPFEKIDGGYSLWGSHRWRYPQIYDERKCWQFVNDHKHNVNGR